MNDIEETVKARCVAENVGGIKETPFRISVVGPGNAPDNIRLSSEKPRTILPRTVSRNRSPNRPSFQASNLRVDEPQSYGRTPERGSDQTGAWDGLCCFGSSA
ncbi:hypothetical protein L596_023296 [Steinernema carpocapsae]|uniref:Uncharacterized protein n=1 Tax=Steinernema carpocapsae TaxID=34508 RepID=A0A4U5MDF8_STECR|nr:hypothetical protein L596_023296 [Steinernema carpocapsae]